MQAFAKAKLQATGATTGDGHHSAEGVVVVKAEGNTKFYLQCAAGGGRHNTKRGEAQRPHTTMHTAC
jgi:hypothetical protein